MKVSYRWLKEFLDVPETPQQVASRLTSLGLAVDAIESRPDDAVLELDVPTNRSDCLSHLGIARELAASYGAALKLPTVDLREGEARAEDVFSISIAEPDLCARYCGRYIAGVKIGPSPDWLKSRLEALGLRPVNNVADITNYVMFELGQPLHGFDADTLEKRQIIVRRAGLDEEIVTLDGAKRELNPSMLVIADGRRAAAVAGVMGGRDTEISPSTTNVLLESANFDPLAIRKTSRALGLSSEASYRFERGADLETAPVACDRAAALVQMLAGGTVYHNVIDVYPRPRKPVRVRLRRARIAAFLGAAIADAVVEQILERLGFRRERVPDGWIFDVPAHRADVDREEDLLEEIARHYGFERFPSTLPKSASFGSALPSESAERLLRNRMAAAGFSEIVPMVFSDESVEKKFRPAVDAVRLLNPMAEDEAVLRTSQVPGMLKTIEWNLNRGVRDMQLYELGKSYSREGERRSLIFAATGLARTKSVHEPGREYGFFDMKGAVEDLFDAFNIELKWTEQPVPPYYHPGRSFNGGGLVIFGELHPDYAAEYKFRRRVYLAEVDFELMLDRARARAIRPVPRFPSVRRDFSLLLTKETRYAEVEEAVRRANIPELERVEPFDRLETGPFPESRYALAIALTYRSAERTLTDDEVDVFDKTILNSLQQRLGAELRQ